MKDTFFFNASFNYKSETGTSEYVWGVKYFDLSIPSWLIGENEINHLSKHVLSKGTLAAIIYKAMLEAVTDGDK